MTSSLVRSLTISMILIGSVASTIESNEWVKATPNPLMLGFTMASFFIFIVSFLFKDE